MCDSWVRAGAFRPPPFRERLFVVAENVAGDWGEASPGFFGVFGFYTMVNRNLIRGLDYDEGNWDEQVDAALNGSSPEEIDWGNKEIESGEIVEGRVLRTEGAFILVDVGYKSEGIIPLSEWDDPTVGEPPKPGEMIRVLVEELEEGMADDYRGMITLSRRKAEKIEAWRRVMESVHEGDTVTGRVSRKIKGGLLVDIGVNVFLPASQVDIRRPADIDRFVGQEIQCMVLKIDEARRNIVVSRRELLDQERREKKERLLAELQVGQLRRGVVKNIADFGVFVDLGGIDGLLHITDMSWGRVSDPKELVQIDQELEVLILDINYEREKIALGLKQKTPSPWENVEEKYPIGSRHTGTVVNVMSYGAFVKLEEGIEGLVHISEMSWTRRISNPEELVHKDDEIEVVVLGINKEKQEISLGMKQTQENPWDLVVERYPSGSVVTGTVRNLTNYGAFIELEEGIDGLLHVSDMSWTRKVSHPNEVVEKGQKIECRVLSVDQNRHRIALGLKQLSDDPWERDIPEKYTAGQIVTGQVTKITNFGVFVGLEHGLEGLLHISELADQKVENPEEIVKVGEDLQVKVLQVDVGERKIKLSRKRVEWSDEANAEAEAAEATETTTTVATPSVPAHAEPTLSATELRGGVGGSQGPLFDLPLSITQPEEPSDQE